MICDGNGRMAPLVGTFYQSFCLGYTIHIAHFRMTVKFHTLLRAGVHSGAAEIGDFLNSGDGAYGKLTIETVNRSNAFDFQEGTFFHMLFDLRHLLIAQEHFYCDGICEVRNWENQYGLLISNLSRFHIHNLTADDNLSHFLHNIFQWNRLVLEIPSINNVRIWILAEATTEIAPFAFLFEWLFLERLLFTGCLCFLLRPGSGCLAGCGLFSCFFLSCRSWCCALFFCGKSGMLQHISYFLTDLDSCIFAVPALLRLHIIQRNFQVHSTTLAEYFVKIFNKYLTFLSGNHRIRKCHIQAVIFWKCDLCLLEQIVFQHVVIAKLQFHAGAVGIQEILWRVLSGQMELLDYLHTHFKTRKALSLNLLFQAENMLFMDPAVAFQVNPDTGFGRVAGNLGDDHLFQKFT